MQKQSCIKQLVTCIIPSTDTVHVPRNKNITPNGCVRHFRIVGHGETLPPSDLRVVSCKHREDSPAQTQTHNFCVIFKKEQFFPLKKGLFHCKDKVVPPARPHFHLMRSRHRCCLCRHCTIYLTYFSMNFLWNSDRSVSLIKPRDLRVSSPLAQFLNTTSSSHLYNKGKHNKNGCCCALRESAVGF